MALLGATSNLLLIAGLICPLLLGCGGSDRAGPPPSVGGSAGAGGSSGAAGSGGSAGSAGAPSGAPLVTITSPNAALDPSQDDVLVSDTIDVTCTVQKSTDPDANPVDPSSVRLALLDAQAQTIDDVPGTPTQNDGEYTAPFVLTSIPNGPVSFRCSGSDTSSPEKTGSDTVQTFVDHGPTINVTTPKADSVYPLAGAVPFAFEVLPAPLATGDQEATVASVDLNVGGVTIPATKDPTNPNGYKLSIDFNDKTKFPQPPTGDVPVLITATNQRTPTAAEQLMSYFFKVDGSGPVITVKSHKDQDIIGGKVTLVFSVTDSISAVDPQTVSVELNQVLYLNGNGQWAQTGNDFSFTFDSANVSGSKVQITVNIAASDLAGNPSAGESLVLYLDNYAPTIDLDPGNVRTRRLSGGQTQCSESFDPLGPQATNDLDLIDPFAHFRVLVWDQTNYVTGQTVQYLSATKQDSVILYLQPDSSIPLLVNNDGYPACDVLQTTVGGLSLPQLSLKPITPTGSAWFTTDSPTKEPVLNGCLQGTDATPPVKLCSKASDLSVVIRHDSATVEPVLYGIGSMTGLECTGTGWEIPSQLANATQKEGWFCLAASAKDNVGNAGISPPLRVCFDNKTTPFVPSCANSSEPPPSCTDGCTPPLGFGPAILALH